MSGNMDEEPETGTGAIIKSLLEVSPFFMLAGMGMVASGALLDYVTENLQVFKEVPALLILVPALLGLKGNLEMTLGARLGSHANKKELSGATFWPIVVNNLAAIQCQAIVVGSAASLLAIMENYTATHVWNMDHALMLAASAITAASVASLVLSALMIVIVVLASRAGIDPDNISAPIAGMLGDFATLGIVVLIANGFWGMPKPIFHSLYFLLLGYMVLAVICFFAAKKSEYTQEIVVYGWPPVILSMMLSNLSGPISEASIMRFSTFARFQVVMNGAGGNLAAIFCAKLSTDLMIEKNALEKTNVTKRPAMRGPYTKLARRLSKMGHTRTVLGFDQSDDPHLNIRTSWVEMSGQQNYLKHFMSFRAILGRGDMSRFCRMLVLLILPGQLLFACVVVGVASGWSALPSPMFLGFFILAGFCQVIVLLMASRQLVVMFWRNKIDPDNGASPLVCGLGDLFGTSFMTLAYFAVSWLGGEAYAGNL